VAEISTLRLSAELARLVGALFAAKYSDNQEIGSSAYCQRYLGNEAQSFV
jgi:predicted Zn-dependent protease